ncbi:type II toxin-antitoxin system VapC family toxin [Nostoc sp. TCL240-02]|uniref:type II toxin-antitoxin system VapC family toxin n=1 Tax=Nostoc sp. TCL240-02 TaxID=2572090 RepID=UPI00157F8D1D|nr:type II toxin-antitoxin system VapC family toxin [Nostoc sp. TCL240-02]QKQ75600.1 type II toxin-antitoxin system VapC family toxin [Nostoc sp. TCL240-02]
MSKQRHYCDSCVFLGFLNNESDKIYECKTILQAAEEGVIELFTSTFTMAEVIKIKGEAELDESKEHIIDQLFKQSWIKVVNFEREMAQINRHLVWTYKLKPFDALHLATAIRLKVDYFNTTDQALIKKIPATVGYLADYPEVIVQKPHVEGYTPRLF